MKSIRSFFIFFFFLYALSGYAQLPVPGKVVKVSYNNYSLTQCLYDISDQTGYSFAYRSNLLDSIKPVTLSFTSVSLSYLLDTLLIHNNLNYVFSNDQIILIPRPKREKMKFKGRILSSKDSLPIPYASISLMRQNQGIISDYKGVYEWELSKEYRNDTVIVSSLGFQKRILSINKLMGLNGKYLFLNEAPISIPPVYVSRKEYKKEVMGNKGNFATGSIYIDTHGQQIALFIKNKHNVPGQLLTISFYVAETGNTSAPLRIRIYSVDSSSGSPGTDLLPVILVVQPTVKKGWYTIDLQYYNIYFPGKGLFVALEGVFPNDYDYYSSSNEFIDISNKTINTPIETETSETVSYGQQLGYNRRKAKNTWHYSLAHTWFQLPKQKFGVMIKATVRIEKHRKRKDKHRKK